ncbi:MAG: L-glutamate gamma-semialdehyde dehydrogenase [Gemmatimonadota bacterium]|jgi:1-pyrroline-5-carboxylate dehydrogenase|nr:1-pyrroline-5-carboxylate dehydrogenase [Gemmatimonadota bacterium]MDP6529019.1 L-glutamate gamma-semialdehyde dehydrogenase [Gemmatimonadota bacterium]MDP6802240.1 L-glutamate gamma-semialdehyde dehydrogenase [Gemmatimonadota bacterium]MDP7032161.1 L-glutamate gamma-semialdehyde dehydrogenase [Gemmatimonadota bacterium]
MANGIYLAPEPVNEPVLSFAPGTPERDTLQREITKLRRRTIEIPLVIGGRKVRTGRFGPCRVPHDHGHSLGRYHKAGKAEVDRAIAAAAKAWPEWSRMAPEDRAAIFLRAAELLAGPWRQVLNAATVLGQSKTCHQAEIDAACELIDFLRFNVSFMQEIHADQPVSGPGVWNRVESRPLEGFVFAVTPFNFTSIAGNLPTAPALMGNTVVWKPASSAVYSAHFLMRLFEEAGLPPGVINLVPGSGGEVGDPALADPALAGVHFTGSTEVFHGIWRTIGTNIERYHGYPRIVGETGGKDFVFAHESADPAVLATSLVRGAFEYQGQKCSAASRAYIPRSMWRKMRDNLLDQVGRIRMGNPEDFGNFMGAVIDENAYRTISGFIRTAKRSASARVLAGGGCSGRDGWFIEPTVVQTTDPGFRLLREEIFGPVLTIYVYPDGGLDRALRLCDETSPYALTGAVFARDRKVIADISDRLRHAAGNFYINDKPTGAVVGQQPFGGSRASGTNDKAGSSLNLSRWVTPRTIKEQFVGPQDFPYPFMDPED